jgi:hypothetical protein
LPALFPKHCHSVQLLPEPSWTTEALVRKEKKRKEKKRKEKKRKEKKEFFIEEKNTWIVTKY